MAVDDALHDGQADPGAGKFVRAVQPLKYAEQFPGIAHVEAHAVVAHPVDGLGPVDPGADLDARRALLAGVLAGIADEVDPDLLEHGAIGGGRGPRPDAHARPGARAPPL